jgi:aminotransferase
MGYACAQPDIIEAMMKIHQYTMLCAPILSQEAALEALKDPATDIGEMKSEYIKHRNFMYGSFREMELPCNEPGGAFYMFPRIDGLGCTSKEFALQLLEEEEVAVVPGTAFGPGGEGFVRCSFATGLADIKEAMTRMGRFVERLRKK